MLYVLRHNCAINNVPKELTTRATLFFLQIFAMILCVWGLRILSFNMSSLSKTIMLFLIKWKQFPISDTFIEFLSRRRCLFFVKTNWCNFIWHCDVGQHIFNILVCLDWSIGWWCYSSKFWPFSTSFVRNKAETGFDKGLLTNIM